MLPGQNCFWSFAIQSASSFQSESRSGTSFLSCISATFGATSRRTVSPIWPVAASASSLACISLRGNHSRSILIVGLAFAQSPMNFSYQSPCLPGVPWIQSWSRIVTTVLPAAGLAAAAGAEAGAAAAAGEAAGDAPGDAAAAGDAPAAGEAAAAAGEDAAAGAVVGLG